MKGPKLEGEEVVIDGGWRRRREILEAVWQHGFFETLF
jgi:hypothetical protein